MIVPYPHQVKMLDEARASFFEHQAIILQSATGSGKTVLGTLVAQGAAAKKRRVMFTVHRDFLVDQTSQTFMDVGLDHGIIAAGYSPSPRELVQVASIDTLKHRLDKVQPPDLLIVDEGHHSVAAGWARVIQAYMQRGTKVLALTATPIRLDGRGLSEVGYTHMVRGPSVRWLIDNNFLCDYEAYAPSLPDLSGVHTRMGDYIKAEAEQAVDKPTITGDAIREYSRLAGGKRAVGFCISVKHSQHVCEQFNAAGIPAAHIDGTTDRGIRKRLLGKFRSGEILVLTSVDIFGEGFDLPAVEAAILLRPTQSLSLHLQQIGRALRTSPGKERAIILDHVGNLMRLGLPDSDFEWSLEGRPKGKGRKGAPPVEIKQCKSCYFVYPPAPVCPNCGEASEISSREIEQVEGELQKLDRAAMLAATVAKKKELKAARTLPELEELGRARGYSPEWAEHTFNARKQKREDALDRWGQKRAESQFESYRRW